MITAEQARDDHLPREIDAFVALARHVESEADVPSCPGWTARDLIIHVGNVHRWVVQAITTGDASDPEPAVIPEGELTAWYRRVADEMLTLFADREPDSPCWTFGMPPRTAAFWFRRQCHEVAMHRWDLGAAAGLDVGYDPALAVDGIDEVATIFFPRQVRLGRILPLTASLALAPDGAEPYVFAGDGTGSDTETDATRDASVSGPADALLLLLWGRLTLDDPRVSVRRSRSAAATVLAAGLVP